MADATVKKLLRLLQTETPVELRRAAVIVMGEVGDRDPESSAVLCETIDDPDAEVRLQGLEAIGKLRIEKALARLLKRVEEGGPEAEVAARAAARTGARGTRALKELMAHVAPGLRRKIAGALGASGNTGAESAAIDSLLDSDPGVVEASVRALVGEVPSLSAAHRRSLADHLLTLLKQARKNPLPLVSEAAIVRLLSALEEPRAEPFFWDRIDPARPAEVRTAALQALGKLAGSPPRERFKLLLSCAADRDFRVAAPAMMILKDVPVVDRGVDDWLVLLQAPDVAARRLALQKLGDHDTAAVARALTDQVDHPDRALREETMQRLRQLRHGPPALVDALLQADTPERAWSLARAQQGFLGSCKAELRDKLLAHACKLLEEADRRAEPLLHMLKEADPKSLRERLEERALELRKKKQFDKALVFLRLLHRDPSIGLSVRFELACCGLRSSAKELAAEARAVDPCLEQFAQLLHHHPDELLPLVQKAKWLSAEDLFYLGFHFTERERQEKEFGGQVLRAAIKLSPKSQIAKDARNKLKRAGLE